jgi:CheY-like chemotaxis protein
MGLGLTIVERACWLLGHALELVSEVDRGTGFRVTVPLVGTASATGDAEAVAPNLIAGRTAGLVALVIDNDEAVRAAMSALLEAWGVGVLDAPGESEALALLDDIGIAPDVILADFHLEGAATGLDAIAALRAKHGPLPACLVTADRSRELAARCGLAGIPIVNKPVEPAKLRAVLTSVAAGHSPGD